MAKLIFTYGTVQSSKSAQLIQTHYNYKKQNKNPLVIVASMDSRSNGNIVSRAFTTTIEAIKVDSGTNIVDLFNKGLYDVIMVEEVQFLNKEQIQQLYELSKVVPILTYGLRVDYKNKPFESTAYLMALADEMKECVILCSECGERKARLNGKFIEGILTTNGNSIEIGDSQYRPLCKHCYSELSRVGEV